MSRTTSSAASQRTTSVAATTGWRGASPYALHADSLSVADWAMMLKATKGVDDMLQWMHAHDAALAQGGSSHRRVGAAAAHEHGAAEHGAARHTAPAPPSLTLSTPEDVGGGLPAAPSSPSPSRRPTHPTTLQSRERTPSTSTSTWIVDLLPTAGVIGTSGVSVTPSPESTAAQMVSQLRARELSLKRRVADLEEHLAELTEERDDALRTVRRLKSALVSQEADTVLLLAALRNEGPAGASTAGAESTDEDFSVPSHQSGSGSGVPRWLCDPLSDSQRDAIAAIRRRREAELVQTTTQQQQTPPNT